MIGELDTMGRRMELGAQTEARIDLVWRVSKQTVELASVRYRALLPILALSDLAIPSRLLIKPDVSALRSASHLIVVKCFSSADVELIRHAHAKGIRTIFDLCDNIFVDDYGRGAKVTPAEALRSMAHFLDAIVVPTKALAAVIKQELADGCPVHIIPDGLEDQGMLARQRTVIRRLKSYTQAKAAQPKSWSSLWQRVATIFESRPMLDLQQDCVGPRSERTILWFGNHGSPWSSFGLADILLFRDVLERIARKYSVHLLVVSNNASRFEAEIRPLAIRSTYLEWTPEVLHTALREVDVVIAPSALDEFARCKSANRVLLALHAGVPVVATPTPACELLRGCIWLDDPYQGIDAYLRDPDLVREHLARAHAVIEREFSLRAIASRWQTILEI
ncbi:MAG: glycosyltransferase [Porticoccaceae bacterium]